MIYRRYASLYFIIGIDIDDEINELSMLEFIHNMVETLDKYFENVCELDVSDTIRIARCIKEADNGKSGSISRSRKVHLNSWLLKTE